MEAPAGYGKTTTMISRIAYLFATGGIPNPKCILGLTFSVNAALKVKQEVSEKLPSLLDMKNNPIALSEKVTITNYHGFCKSILKKYAYLLTDILRKDINLFKAIGDGEVERRTNLKTALTASENQTLKGMELSIKNSNTPDSQAIHDYNEIIIRKLLPLEYITHNAVILLVLELFEKFPETLNFYRSYYPLIVVDEFQDTNCIAWQLLKSLITDKTKLVFLGDSLQRIYGFIGALPNIMNSAKEQCNMTKIILSKNYRFRNNPEMLKLDANIRSNAASSFSLNLSETAQLPIYWGKTQQEEATKIVEKIQNITSDKSNKTAILCRARGKNAEIIEEQLIQNEILYFYGMFTDEDEDYIEFHNFCQNMFVKMFGKSKSINKKALTTFADGVKSAHATVHNKTTQSLLSLLDAVIEKVSIDYIDLLAEDKYNLMMDIFENRQLKQAMEYVDSQVVLSTVHGAKGLEWDYVVLSDVEQWVFTFNCRNCTSTTKNAIDTVSCKLPTPIPNELLNPLLDDLCVFYVGLTRARKQIYISASAERFNAQGRQFTDGKVCCFALVNGVKLVNGKTFDIEKSQ